MRQTKKTLTARVAALEETLDKIGTALADLQKHLPAVNQQGAEVLVGLAAMLKDITVNGIKTPSLQITNKAGEAVLVMGATDGGDGLLSLRNASGRDVAALAVDGISGAGGLVLMRADGALHSRLRVVDGAGRLDLVEADRERVVSFGL